MKQVQAFRCIYCGKLYLRVKACIKHEMNLCLKNPGLRPLCYDCVHYDEADKPEQVEIPFFVSDGEHYTSVGFYPNKCECLGCKLFCNIRVSKNTYAALEGADYEPMPNLRAGGCEHFKSRKEESK